MPNHPSWKASHVCQRPPTVALELAAEMSRMSALRISTRVSSDLILSNTSFLEGWPVARIVVKSFRLHFAGGSLETSRVEDDAAPEGDCVTPGVWEAGRSDADVSIADDDAAASASICTLLIPFPGFFGNLLLLLPPLPLRFAVALAGPSAAKSLPPPCRRRPAHMQWVVVGG